MVTSCFRRYRQALERIHALHLSTQCRKGKQGKLHQLWREQRGGRWPRPDDGREEADVSRAFQVRLCMAHWVGQSWGNLRSLFHCSDVEPQLPRTQHRQDSFLAHELGPVWLHAHPVLPHKDRADGKGEEAQASDLLQSDSIPYWHSIPPWDVSCNLLQWGTESQSQAFSGLTGKQCPTGQWHPPEVLKEHQTEVEAMGQGKIGDFGTHSLHKGVSTHLASLPGGPSPAALSVRDGWSMGTVKDIYFDHAQGGDEFCGRCACLLNMMDESFLMSALFFHEDADQQLIQDTINSTFPHLSKMEGMGQILRRCLASLVNRSKHVAEHLDVNHPIRSIPLYRDLSAVRALTPALLYVKASSKDPNVISGCPPYIRQLAYIAKIKFLQESVVEDVVKRVMEETTAFFDKQEIGGGNWTDEPIQESMRSALNDRISEMEKHMQDKWNKLARAFAQYTGNNALKQRSLWKRTWTLTWELNWLAQSQLTSYAAMGMAGWLIYQRTSNSLTAAPTTCGFSGTSQTKSARFYWFVISIALTLSAWIRWKRWRMRSEVRRENSRTIVGLVGKCIPTSSSCATSLKMQQKGPVWMHLIRAFEPSANVWCGSPEASAEWVGKSKSAELLDDCVFQPAQMVEGGEESAGRHWSGRQAGRWWRWCRWSRWGLMTAMVTVGDSRFVKGGFMSLDLHFMDRCIIHVIHSLKGNDGSAKDVWWWQRFVIREVDFMLVDLPFMDLCIFKVLHSLLLTTGVS